MSTPAEKFQYQVGGSLEKQAPCYVTRQADEDFYQALKAGEFCYVLNSRQMGKSSLRVRVMQRLQAEGVACATIDITSIGSQGITADQWYLGIVRRLVRAFRVKMDALEWWNGREGLSPVQRLSEFLEEELLVAVTQPIAIFIDEIDSILKLDFKDDFFALIRACYNQRAERSDYQRLTFALLGVATPSNLIQDKNRTPFNIGRAIQLNGVQFEEARSLAQGLTCKAANPEAVLQEILNWTGGQPFLTQKLCQLVLASSGLIPEGEEAIQIERLVQTRVIENWESQDEPEHLRTIRDRLLSNKQRVSRLLGIYQQALQQDEIESDNSSEQMELCLSGLVVEHDVKLSSYNRIYELVFNQDWLDRIFSELRPYSEGLNSWIASGYKDESRLLRGEALEEARIWVEGKSLSDQDYQFLAASQELEKRDVQIALDAEKQANQILAKAQYKANKRIRIGSAVLGITLLLATITGVFAQRKLQEADLRISKADQEVKIANRARDSISKDAVQKTSDLQRAEKAFKVAAQQVKVADSKAKLTKVEVKLAEQKVRAVNQELASAKIDLTRVSQESTQKTTALQQVTQKIQVTEKKVKQAEYTQQRLQMQAKIAESSLEEAKSKLFEALSLLGSTSTLVGYLDKAIDSYQKLRVLAQENKDLLEEARVLEKLGNSYMLEGSYEKAFDTLQQGIVIARKVDNPLIEGNILRGLGGAYFALGSYRRSLDYQQQSLIIARRIKDQELEGKVLGELSTIYIGLGDSSQAISYANQSLAMMRGIKNQLGEGNALRILGLATSLSGGHDRAIEYFKQGLEVLQEVGDRLGSAITLRELGFAYFRQGKNDLALNYCNKSLAVQQNISGNSEKPNTLSCIAQVFEKKNDPQAIIFYKQLIIIREGIRQTIKVLPLDLQKSYVATSLSDYSALSTLLVAQGKISEAEQINTLVKPTEDSGGIALASRGDKPSVSVGLTSIETQITEKYGSLITFGAKLEECRKTQCPQLVQLLQQRDQLLRQYDESINAIAQSIRKRTDQQELPKAAVQSAALQSLTEAQPGTVVIYSLVLEDKIWLLWASKGNVIRKVAVSVTRKQLSKVVLRFRESIQDRFSPDFLSSGRELYELLIKPLEQELETNKVRHLVFAPDNILRSIPMSALFDGKRYLIERYSISYILSAELTDLGTRPSLNKGSVLALGVSQASSGFAPLPYVRQEIQQIQNIFPASQVLLDQALSLRSLEKNLSNHRIIHLATHGSFLSGNPKESFLLLGTGEKLTLSEIESLRFRNTDLVVLSAAQTALGGVDQDGIEIPSMSYFFLKGGAKAVIASLWNVDDQSTSKLMTRFYQSLASGQTKAEALRQAQLSLLTDGSHPFFWAPFVLVGNWL